MKIDFHIHSMYSPDSTSDVRYIVSAALRSGMDAIAITDHNTTKGAISAMKLADSSIVIVPGCELSTAEGHLICLGIEEDIAVRIPIAEAVERVTALGGIAFPSHPFRIGTGVGRAVLESIRPRCIETINGRNHESKNAPAIRYAAENGIGGTGGSDAHTPGEVGRAYTEIEGGGISVSDILQAVSAGKCTARGHGQTAAGSFMTQLKIFGEYLGRKGKHI
jgi:predicted metal-dependent phosphoesterase TrpH